MRSCLAASCLVLAWASCTSPEREPDDAGRRDDAGRDAGTRARPELEWVLAAGAQHTCAIRAGRLYCWGNNHVGQLGVPSTVTSDTPAGQTGWFETSPRAVGDETGWTAIATGFTHTCGVRDGAAYCWGSNENGKLGLGDMVARAAPTRVGTRNDWTAIAAGGLHTCGIAGGELLCWGFQFEVIPNSGRPPPRLEPARVGEHDDWSQLSSGYAHVCALRAHEIHCLGLGFDGALGIPRKELPGDPALAIPRPVAYDDWERVSAGGGGSCGLRGGRLYCWGQASLFPVAPDAAPSANEFEPVRIGDDDDWTAVGIGTSHVCGLRGDVLFCWGSSELGALGLGSTLLASEPQAVPPDGWTALAVGAQHTCALRDGALFCFGLDGHGQLGISPGQQAPLRPTELPAP